MQNEIFGISLNEEGRRQIVQVYKKIRIIFIAAIVWSMFSLLSLFVQLTKMKELSGIAGRTNSQLYIIYIFWALHFLIFPVQGYYYFAFSKRMKISTEVQDSDKFNSSFRLLAVNATLVLFSFLIDFSSMTYNFLWPWLRQK